ncbi:MAG: type II secretion system protein [Candidatus Omnitrophota bacterium]
MKKNGFTYIELLITLAIMGVLFVPIMQLFSHSLYSTTISQDLITAANLAKWEMEKVKNLNITTENLQKMGNSIYPDLESPPLELNNMKWRIKREFIQGSSPLEVWVYACRDNKLDQPVVTLVTLIEDTFWEEVQPVK